MKRKRQKTKDVAGMIQYGIMVALDTEYIEGNVFAGFAHTSIRNLGDVWQEMCLDLAKEIISELDKQEENENSHL